MTLAKRSVAARAVTGPARQQVGKRAALFGLLGGRTEARMKQQWNSGRHRTNGFVKLGCRSA